MFYAVSSLLAFLICSVLSGFLYFYNRNSVLYRKFLILSFFIGMWSLCPFIVSYSVDSETALYYGRFVYVFAIFTMPVLFNFICTALEINLINPYKKIFFASLIMCCFFLLFSYSDLFIKGFVSRAPNVYVVPGFLYDVFVVCFIILCVYAVVILYNRYKKLTSLYEKERLKFLAISFFILYIAGLMHLLEPFFKIEIIPHDLLVIFWFFIVLYTVSKYRYLNIKLAFVKTLIFITIYVIILVVPIAIGIITRKWIISALSLLVLSSLGPVFFSYIQKRSENFLQSEQIKYQQFLIWASRVIAKQQNINKLSNLVVRIIQRRVKVTFVSFFIFDAEKNIYTCKSDSNMKRKGEIIKVQEYSKVISYMQKMKTPFIVFALPYEIKMIFSKINNGIHLVIPIMLRDRLIAFLLLGDKVNKSIYSSGDIEIFTTISNQIGLAISNANFIEQIKIQQDKIFEIRKLASIGGMAGGMAHQIKNRLHQFSMASGLMDVEIESFLKEYKIKDEQCKNFVNTMKEIAYSVSSNVHYTNEVVQNILSFAKKSEKELAFSNFSLKEALKMACQLLKVKHQKDEINIDFDIPEQDSVYGSKSQIQEVLFNCLDNAYEAVEEKKSILHKNMEDIREFKPFIRVSLKYSKNNAIISVTDNGIGIKQENKSKMFSPFFTTKELNNSGTGIGSYVIKRMIEENHKGQISFKSEYGEGTTFTIVLPKEIVE
ncbi:ATP-binding protein [Candidatus Ruminimicrobium bovinum]|uniref:ATP-binding protein n=1 Tax=Candidatus Ruminimicrobium bovinum TaxID=3242779 RepID=UPI0039B8CEC6